MKFGRWMVCLVMAVVHVAGFGQGMQTEKGVERVQHLKKVRMIEILDLTEDQSVRFFARLNEYEKERAVVLTEKTAALDKVERLVRNRADGNEFNEVFPTVFDFDVKLAKQDAEFFQSLNDLLSPEQQAKLLIFDRQFERELREGLVEIYRRRQTQGE